MRARQHHDHAYYVQEEVERTGDEHDCFTRLVVDLLNHIINCVNPHPPPLRGQEPSSATRLSRRQLSLQPTYAYVELVTYRVIEHCHKTLVWKNKLDAVTLTQSKSYFAVVRKVFAGAHQLEY
jgi:hypothetical protein